MSHRLFYSKIDGQILGESNAGGELNGFTGEDLIKATFKYNPELWDGIGCLDDFDPLLFDQQESIVDQVKVPAYEAACAASKIAKQAMSDFILETNIRIFHDIDPSREKLEFLLKIGHIKGQDEPVTAEVVGTVQTDWDAVCVDCDAKGAAFQVCCDGICIAIPLATRRKRDEALGRVVGNIWKDPSYWVPDAYKAEGMDRDPLLPDWLDNG